MRSRRNIFALALFFAACASAHAAQAPNVIQFFMPDNSTPPREIRFTLTREDGRIEELFTDSKGKYSMASGLVRSGEYTVTAVGDGSSYDTTVTNFRITRPGEIVYVTVFLRPLRRKPAPRPRVIDVSAEDANVPAEASAAYDRGIAAIEKGDAEMAVASLQRALELHPTYLRALNDLGVLYLKLSRLDEAADAFTRALKVNGRFELARLNLGMVLDRQGKYVEAVKLLGTLFRENPSLPGARLAYADVLYNASRFSEAEKILRAGLEDRSLGRGAQAELRYKLARALVRQDKFAEGVKELRRAAELEPQSANAQLLLGAALLQLKRDQEAERALLRAYELGARAMAHAQLLLGELYMRRGDNDLALRAFEQYLRDAPNVQNAAQVREVVAKLRAVTQKK